ncbi:MAG: hypothetical protein J0M15_13710 [Deltaproteobacteria bacterium]|nr:hypothetical protein [Deltaproteobacteria bacterium]
MGATRITADLGDPMLLKLLKLEAQVSETSIKDVLVKAIEAYFSHRIETRALGKMCEKAFEEWDNPLDSDYDKL